MYGKRFCDESDPTPRPGGPAWGVVARTRPPQDHDIATSVERVGGMTWWSGCTDQSWECPCVDALFLALVMSHAPVLLFWFRSQGARPRPRPLGRRCFFFAFSWCCFSSRAFVNVWHSRFAGLYGTFLDVCVLSGHMFGVFQVCFRGQPHGTWNVFFSFCFCFFFFWCYYFRLLLVLLFQTL